LAEFITVGGGALGVVAVPEVEVVLVVLVAELVVEVEVDPWRLDPHAARTIARIPVLAARATERMHIATRGEPLRGRCEDRVTAQRLSSLPPSVIG
jgi:hypothetical protein